jgi:hypothetical protein
VFPRHHLEFVLVLAAGVLLVGCRVPQQSYNPPPVEGDHAVPETVLGPIDPLADGQLHRIIDDKLGTTEGDAGATGSDSYARCHPACCPPAARAPGPEREIECCLCEEDPD